MPASCWIRAMHARLAFMAAFMLTGCGPEPLERPGTWHAGGLNDQNLRAMLAEPPHALRGIGAPDSRGDNAAAAVERLRQDKLRPLLDPRGSGGGANGGR
jgi:hypothetical protein